MAKKKSYGGKKSTTPKRGPMTKAIHHAQKRITKMGGKGGKRY